MCFGAWWWRFGRGVIDRRGGRGGGVGGWWGGWWGRGRGRGSEGFGMSGVVRLVGLVEEKLSWLLG